MRAKMRLECCFFFQSEISLKTVVNVAIDNNTSELANIPSANTIIVYWHIYTRQLILFATR